MEEYEKDINKIVLSATDLNLIHKSFYSELKIAYNLYKDICKENIAAFEEILTKQFGFFQRTIKDSKIQLVLLNRLLLALGLGNKPKSYDEFILNEEPIKENQIYEADYYLNAEGKVIINNLKNIKSFLNRYKKSTVTISK